MRLITTSSLGWLGGLAFSTGILYFVATGEESGPPTGSERVVDAPPAAFSTGDGNASGSGHALHGGEDAVHGHTNSKLTGEPTAALLDGDWSLDKIVPARGFEDLKGADNPLPTGPVNLALVPQNTSGSVYADAYPDLLPSTPTGSPLGNSATGSTKSGSATGGFFIVSYGGNLGLGTSISAQAAPEPSSWVLGGVAFGVLIYLRRRAVSVVA